MAEGQTFLSGFAQAFNAARARTEEQNAEQENLIFKYKMDNLMEQKQKREAKKVKETENANKAKDLAAQLGDPDSASMFYKEISNGVDYTELQKRVVNGDYQKNSNYKAPTQTIKMPSGVSPTVQYDEEMNPLQPENKGIFAQGKQKSYDRMMGNVNQKIDQIDPSLRQGPSSADNEFSTTSDDTNSKYNYKPKNVYKLGDYGDALYKLSKAQESGDPVALREAQTEVGIHQRILTEKAKADALAQGKNVSKYFSVNPDGSIGAQFAGERREDGLYNISNPNGEQLVSGPVRMMDDKDVARYDNLVDNFGKASQDYNSASTNFIGALDSSQKMAQILHEDPDAATTSSNVLGTIQSLTGEAQAAFKAIDDMQNKINSNIESGKLDSIEKDISEYSSAVEKFVDKGILSDANQQKAINAAKFRSLQMQTAYQIAVANATDGKVSKNDLDNAMQIIGKSSDPRQILAALNTQMNGAFLKLASTQNTLNKNPSIVDFESRSGLKTGLRGKRIGDQIQEMDIPDDRKQVLMQYLSSVGKQFADGQVQTQQSLQQQPQAQPNAQEAIQKGGIEFNDIVIPKGAVDILKAQPDAKFREIFDRKFGKGASAKILGEK